MEGGGAAAALEVLLQNLINVSKEEISLIQGLEKDADKLKTTLAIIQSFVNDAEKKFITDDAVKTWLKELEALAFDADNVLDELHYDVLSKNTKKSMKTQKKKVPSCFPSFKHYAHRRQTALSIKEINMSFESINKKATELGLERRLAIAPPAPDVGSLETDSFTVDPIFIGRENNVSNIVGMLTRSPTEQVFSILPIVGMGGLGKTALARKVFNHEQIKTYFGKRIWVHVSKDFDPVRLLEKILTTLKSGKVEVENREVILQQLKEALQAKTYLLVLDDVWDRDQLKWEGFINSLSGISSMKGNAIIVTSRITEVASIVQTLDVHQPNGLSEEDCWFIIQKKAFEGGDIPLGFEPVGRNIAKRCQGLPLAANVVGGVLRNKSIDEWHSIEKNWLSDVVGDENNISKILKLSFDNLSLPSLKKCFAYCSIFPKGNKINKQKLIELWMAEGFIQFDQRNDMETVGNKYFNILLRNSLLQVVERDGIGDVRFCNMHDLVHDLACSILDGIYQVRYINHSHDGGKSDPIAKEQVKCLRTLFFEGEISDIKFSNFKSLHVLILRGYNVEELPTSVKELIHLRYLEIYGTEIQYMPDSIGELHHLQTLSAIELQTLPSTLKYLIALRHLHISYELELPPEIGRLTSLRTLPYFHVGDEKDHRGIAELGNLQNLQGELEISNLENVRNKDEAKSAYLFQKPNIVKLVFHWNVSTESTETNDENVLEGLQPHPNLNDENVLEGLQPHPNLKSLEIKGFRGKRFPLWTLTMAVRDEIEDRWIELNNLMEIRLSACKECETIPTLGHLPRLRSLYLSKLENVRSIDSSFYGIDNCSSNNGVCEETINVFPSLKRLKLIDMPNLIEWAAVEISSAAETQPRKVKIFSCLEYLKIRDCNKLMNTPSHFPCLKELKLDGMESGFPLACICGIKTMSLTEVIIWHVEEMDHLPDWLFCNNQNLSKLDISYCPNLIELPDGLHRLHSLKELTIDCCPNLKSIPYAFSSGGPSQGLTSLHTLLIDDCKELIDLPCEMLVSCVPSLRHLSLKDLNSFRNLPLVIDCVQKMPCLEWLDIVKVPQFFSSPFGNFRNNLRRLSIAPSPDSSADCGSFNKIVDGILQGCLHSLVRLDLCGMGHWDSLPDQLQHLTALHWLALFNFGIETLPEWFGNLSSLIVLRLRDCEKLRHMPSKQAMQRLTKLEELDIYGCPLLEERCIEQQNSDDSEWPNISHIPEIRVNSRLIPSHPQSTSQVEAADENQQDCCWPKLRAKCCNF